MLHGASHYEVPAYGKEIKLSKVSTGPNPYVASGRNPRFVEPSTSSNNA